MPIATPSATPPTRSIATTAPLQGGGDLSADRTLSISAASGSAAGSQSIEHFDIAEGLRSLVYDQRVVSTASSGDQIGALRAALNVFNVGAGTVFSGIYRVLLAPIGNPAYLDFRVFSANATRITASQGARNDSDGNAHPQKIRYSLDSGATFTDLVTGTLGIGSETTISGHVDLSQTTTRPPVIFRFEIDATTLDTRTIGWTNISLVSSNGPMTVYPGVVGAGVTWAQPLTGTESTGDKSAVLRAARQVSAFAGSTEFAGFYFTLLQLTDTTGFLDYEIVSVDAAKINASFVPLDGTGTGTGSAKIQYSLDNGASFTDLATGGINFSAGGTPVAGSIDLGQTTRRCPVILRFWMTNTVLHSAVVGIERMSISVEAGTLQMNPNHGLMLTAIPNLATDGSETVDTISAKVNSILGVLRAQGDIQT